ncbi:MAG TPA: response regulator [Polyangiaceae bacterium]|jgi:PAS domain S-box-containing protein
MSDDRVASSQGGAEPPDAAERLRFILERAPLRLFAVDQDGIFVLNEGVNPAGGTKPGALVGINALAAYRNFPEGLAALEAARSGRDASVRYERDGITYDLHLVPRRNASGGVIGVLGMAVVVTERVAAERARERSEQHFRSVVDTNMMCIAFFGPGGRLTDANAAFRELSGYTEADIQSGLLDAARLTPPGHEAADQRAREETAARGVCTPYEKELLHKDGRRIPVLVGGAVVEAGLSIAFLLDLTERRKAELARESLQGQLLQIQKLDSLGLLAGGVAHDFNNLLTAIIGSASTALLALPEENPIRHDLDNIMLAARRAATLTRQLLAYAGKGHFEVRTLDVSRHVGELSHLLETTIPKKVQLRLELAQGLPPIAADVGQLQQVLTNLVINGAEAIGQDNGIVSVKTGVQDIDADYARELFPAESVAQGRHVFVEVVDSGSGMDTHTVARIFDPFFSTKFTGRGLGLAAVLGIVRVHKGAIKVYSALGKGTTIKVLFPAVDGSAQIASPPALDFRGEGLVLVVDDDRGVREVATRLLQFFGFSVIQAENGRLGVEAFARHSAQVKVVLLDMTMPEMGGDEAFRAMRRIRPNVPVILTSGYNELEATHGLVSKGLTGFLQKPFAPRDLAEKLASACKPSDDR